MDEFKGDFFMFLMRGAFEGATNFNGNISEWKTSSVVKMKYIPQY